MKLANKKSRDNFYRGMIAQAVINGLIVFLFSGVQLDILMGSEHSDTALHSLLCWLCM